MQIFKFVLNTVLSFAVLYLSYNLFSIINDPIKFEKKKKVREDAVIERLIDIREAQLAYRDLKGGFADSWSKLIHTIKTDSIAEIKIIGNPDDTTQITTYDTSYSMLLTRVFTKDYPINQINLIPFSKNEKFILETGQITANRVKIPVLKVSAPDKFWLIGLDPKYIDPSHALTIGSLTEARYTGNWE